METVKEMVKTFEDLIRRMFAPSMTFFAVLFIVHALNFLWVVDVPAPSTAKQSSTTVVTKNTAKSIIDDTQKEKTITSTVTSKKPESITNADLFNYGVYKEPIYLFLRLKPHLPSGGLAVMMVLVLLIGMSYFLSTLQALLYDNFLRKSFEPMIGYDSLEFFRSEVINRLTNINILTLKSDEKDSFIKRIIKKLEELNILNPPSKHTNNNSNFDYFLYEIIGGIDQGSTVSFVNDAKAYGIVCISVMLSIASLIPLDGFSYSDCLYAPIIIIIFFIGREMVKTQYRSRSLRHYVNFLMMPEAKIKAILGSFKDNIYFDDSAPQSMNSAPQVS